MIQLVRAFCIAQRRYLAFLVGLAILYGLLLLREQPQSQTNGLKSPQYQTFQETEKKFQAELSADAEGQLDALFQRKPVATVLFLGYTVIFFGLFLGGCILLLFWFGSKRTREYWSRSYPLEERVWPLSVLLRVLVHFLTLSLLLNLSLSALVWRFPQFNSHGLALLHTALMDAAVAFLILRELGFSWQSVKSFGFDLKGRSVWQEGFFGLTGYMAVIPIFAAVLFILITVAQKFSYEPEPHALVDVFLSKEKGEQWMIGFSIFLACLWGPFFEEIFFRGLCYPIFKRKLGALQGGILSSLLFALIHHNQFAFLPIFLLGLGLVYLYEKRGNLVAPIVLHIFHNSLFIGYFFTAKALMEQG